MKPLNTRQSPPAPAGLSKWYNNQYCILTFTIEGVCQGCQGCQGCPVWHNIYISVVSSQPQHWQHSNKKLGLSSTSMILHHSHGNNVTPVAPSHCLWLNVYLQANTFIDCDNSWYFWLIIYNLMYFRINSPDYSLMAAVWISAEFWGQVRVQMKLISVFKVSQP